MTKQDKLGTPKNITWGLVSNLKCTLRFFFSLEWICYCKFQKKNWKYFLNHQLITQIKISLIGQAQVEFRAAIFYISCRLRHRPVQLQKHPRSRQLQSVSSPGMEDLQCDLQCDLQHNLQCNQYLATGNLQHNWQCDQAPHTHSYIGRSNMTSSLAHIPSLLTLQVEPNLKTFSRTLSPEALRYLHLGIHIGKSLLIYKSTQWLQPLDRMTKEM